MASGGCRRDNDTLTSTGRDRNAWKTASNQSNGSFPRGEQADDDDSVPDHEARYLKNVKDSQEKEFLYRTHQGKEVVELYTARWGGA